MKCVLFTAFATLLAPTLAWSKPPAPKDDETVVVDDVVVTGSRTEHSLSEAPIATELITRKEIETSGAENAADILEEHPGVDMFRSFSGAGIRLQGLDSKHILVLVDGERIGGRINGVIDLRRLPAESIERIEIVKGPSSALYGSEAMGGVINIITRSAQKPYEAEIHGAYGSFNTVDASAQLGLQQGAWNAIITGGFHRIDAFDLTPETPNTTGSELSQFNIANRTQYRFSKSTRLIGRTSYLQRDQKGIDSNSVGAVYDRRNLTETLTASLGPEIKFGTRGKLRLTGTYNLFRDQYVLDQRKSNAKDKDEETLEHLGQLTLQYDRLLFNSHLLTVGTEGLYEHLTSDRLENKTSHRYRGAVFIQDEWTILDSPALVLVPGARVDLDSQFGTHPTPKVAVRFDPHDTVTLRASYGMGFRAPVFKELYLLFENPDARYVVQGNPELKPETSHSVNVGVDYVPFLWAGLSLNFFHNDIDELIFSKKLESDGMNARYTYTNLTSVYTQGLESKLKIALMRGLMVSGGYTLTLSKNREQNRPLEGRAKHRGTVDLRYSHAIGLDAVLRGSIIGPRPFYEPGSCQGETSCESDVYATLDTRIAQRLGQTITLFLGVKNLLDAGEPNFLPIQPRTYYGGVTGRL